MITMKFILMGLLMLSACFSMHAHPWTLIKGASRFGAAAILFTNYAIMRALVIPHTDREDIKQELDDNKKLRQVYTFYKNASLVCGIGLLLPKKFPQIVQKTFYKYW